MRASWMLADVFVAVALTGVHVGVGRNPGVVDLPVARDPFGLPYVPGSGLKGSVKSACLARLGGRECEVFYGWDVRLRGGEAIQEPYVSPVSFTDAHILLYPVRGEDEKGGLWYGYATSLGALNRLLTFISTLEGLFCRSARVEELRVFLEEYLRECGERVTGILLNDVFVDGWLLCERFARRLCGLLAGGNRAVEHLCGRLVVLDDSAFLPVVEAGLVRVTRVRLDYLRKAVEGGALWSEEYVPELTIFWFSSIYRSTVAGGEHIPAVKAREWHLSFLESLDNIIVVGGKETIGKGLLRVYHVSR